MKIRKAAVAMAVAGSALTVTATATPGARRLVAQHRPDLLLVRQLRRRGQGRMQSGWQAYDCKGSSAPWASYELWGLY